MRILIVDDEPNIRKTLRVASETMGHTVCEAHDAKTAREQIHLATWDVALVDLRLGVDSGVDLMEEIVREFPQTVVVIITAYPSIDHAVDSMRRGAFDFLPKPFTPAQLRIVLERVERVRGLQQRVADLEEQVRSEIPEVALESSDPAVRRLMEQAQRVASTDAVVLIRGESGTGKGVLARRLHAWSRRAGGPFLTVSCPSLSADLLESELFGHARGAFTGAVRDTEGKVAAAERGTLFLDEVGDLPLPLQPKLLRFLQDKQFEKVGETRTREADVRLVAATNRDLDALAAEGKFREDLLFRLNVIELRLPPLRERTDVQALADHLLTYFDRNAGLKFEGFSQEARERLASHSWPGNLRELRNTVERAVIFARGREIQADDLPDRVRSTSISKPTEAASPVDRFVTLEALEADHIRYVIQNTPTLDDAARVLGIDPSTLYRKRKQLGL